MIYARIDDLSRYKGVSRFLDMTIDFIQKTDLRMLKQGRNEVDGDNVYITRFDYETMPEEKTFYEAHTLYIDVHLLLSGEEYIAVSDTGAMKETERDDTADFIGYAGSAQARFEMDSSKVLIVFPGEAHAVKIQRIRPCLVEKAVCKVKVQ